MSMLAEPRKKQKWSVDPRNSAWSNDDNKFGQKMLEQMGWSKGKGLGRSQQGSTDHIKVKVKNNKHGLGANASHEDNWIAHQDEFNELLAQLNNHHGQTTSNEVPPDEMKSFSLEEKSKISKKRVHYTKFTKGKDLSSRSETDLNCIFGKRTKSTKDQEQLFNHHPRLSLQHPFHQSPHSGCFPSSTVMFPARPLSLCATLHETDKCTHTLNTQGRSRSESPSESEESGTKASSELDTESITKTVTSSLSMQEYFAQRMAQLKKARSSEGSASSVKAETTETSSPAEELSPVHSSNNDAEEPKKKKNKKLEEELVDVEEKCSAPILPEEKENKEKACSRKKKKRKTAEIIDENENSSSASVLEMNCEKPSFSKKKKSKHIEKQLINVHEGEEDHNGVKECEEELVTKKSKKKKRKRENQE
ncbi:PIN2/TERF1-interacting telomerase inhibitor 1 isoform X1 [Xiphophorus couchianus]|uniref:PIN2/TERF1-interacting telomerase inhibitor 1 isoform X1 n=1 Tax=Xiphophorus couchianus TaxID=32473 RepID=UPI001015CEA8|nr:PIN2/TERF1-interacting telomerase inhibitor 1 isoform X1 [Xiphophorus couchianus]